MARLGKWAAALVLGLCWQGSAHAAWSQAKTQHFTIYGEVSDDKLRRFSERLEKFDLLLRKVTGITDPDVGSPVKVYLVSSEDKIHELIRNKMAGGFYTTSDRNAFAVLPKGSKVNDFDMGAEEILFHEYTHHFMLHHFPAAYPAWYVEGFAEFFSVVKFPQDGSIRYGNIPMARVPTLVTQDPYPVEKLFARNTDGLSLRDGDRYYGTAWLLTHYMQFTKGLRKQEIVRYLQDLTAGKPDIKPETYFDGGMAALQKDLRIYMHQKFYIAVFQPKEMKPTEVVITPLDPVQGDLVEQELGLDCHPTEEQRALILTSVRAIAAKNPGSAYALAVQAEAEWAAEEKDAALASAERAIAIDPKSSRAYAIKGRVMLDRAHDSDKAEDWKTALSSIVRANRADTEDPVPLALFYRYHMLKGGKMPDIGYDGMYKAFSLLPQSSDYRFAFAHAMADRKHFEEASTILNPIAYSPHDSGERASALELKAQYDAEAAKQPKVAVSSTAPAGNPAPAS